MRARIIQFIFATVAVFSATQLVYAQPASPDFISTLQRPAATEQFAGISWLDQQQPNRQALDALSFIAASAWHGLDPEDYHLSLLRRLDPRQSDETARYFEILLTVSVLELIHDLAVGRLDPAVADPDWFIPRDTVNETEILHKALRSGHLKSALEQLLPQSPQYYRLTNELVRYQSYVDRGGWQPIPDTPLLKPGERHRNVPAIRARLAVEEPSLSRPKQRDTLLYDQDLVAAVTRFQQRHRLKMDGIIGSETLRNLNIPADKLVQKIKLNLERLRWLPNNLGERYLLVNLGSHQLTAVEDGQSVLNMRVIIGQLKRPTPSFNSEMTHIVFNPYWNVPYKLARKDVLPRQQADPDYFFLHDFKVYLRDEGFQHEVDPYKVDWKNVSASNFPYRLQQLPGEHNALGRLKFMFPNPWNIYLHDTPHKELFEKSQRNFSSGCIRVEDPLALADFSLNQPDAEQWVQQQIDSKENRGSKLKEPLPVYAVYFTVWPVDGMVVLAPDDYRRDERMAKFL